MWFSAVWEACIDWAVDLTIGWSHWGIWHVGDSSSSAVHSHAVSNGLQQRIFNTLSTSGQKIVDDRLCPMGYLLVKVFECRLRPNWVACGWLIWADVTLTTKRIYMSLHRRHKTKATCIKNVVNFGHLVLEIGLCLRTDRHRPTEWTDTETLITKH